LENLPENPEHTVNQFNFDLISEVASQTIIQISNNEKDVKIAALQNSEKESANELEKFKQSLDVNYKIRDKIVSHQNFKEKLIILSVIGLIAFSVFLIYIGNSLGFEILKLSTTAIISFYAGSAYGKKNSQKEK
jgi:hypothetical protein